MTTQTVIKRDGTSTPLDISRVKKVIAWALKT